MELLKPKEIHITDNDSVQRTYTISRMPFMVAREVGIQYGGSILPKVGDYKLNEAMMLKMMNYVAVQVNGQELRLATPQLIDNHVPDLDTGLQLEWAMMEYNAGFFHKGTISDFFGDIVRKTLAKISETLTPSLDASSTQTKPPSTS
jgi:hypothetical protein